MTYVFEVTDKTGRRIYLTKERWKHITSPASPHAYMTNHLEEIQETLIKPDKLTYSVYDLNKANYYKYNKEKRRFLRVIVRYLNGDGFIITSYFIKEIEQ